MKFFTKTKYLFARLTSFLLLTFSANNANGQANGLSVVMYGAPPTASEKINVLVNGLIGLVVWLLICLSMVIIPVIGYRWIFKKGDNKKLIYILKCVVVIFVFLILLKLAVSIMIASVS